MGRHASIDRNHVLDAAEGIVTTQGAAALSIGAVAKAAGISKGGVQSCFGTKEAMIAAMLDRWMAEDAQRFRAAGGTAAAPEARVRAHVESTHGHDEATHARVVGLVTALLQTPEHLAPLREWYAGRMPATMDGEAARRARLALLAVEGAVLLRFSGLLPMTREEWDDLFMDIHGLLGPRDDGKRPVAAPREGTEPDAAR